MRPPKIFVLLFFSVLVHGLPNNRVHHNPSNEGETLRIETTPLGGNFVSSIDDTRREIVFISGEKFVHLSDNYRELAQRIYGHVEIYSDEPFCDNSKLICKFSSLSSSSRKTIPRAQLSIEAFSPGTYTMEAVGFFDQRRVTKLWKIFAVEKVNVLRERFFSAHLPFLDHMNIGSIEEHPHFALHRRGAKTSLHGYIPKDFENKIMVTILSRDETFKLLLVVDDDSNVVSEDRDLVDVTVMEDLSSVNSRMGFAECLMDLLGNDLLDFQEVSVKKSQGSEEASTFKAFLGNRFECQKFRSLKSLFDKGAFCEMAVKSYFFRSVSCGNRSETVFGVVESTEKPRENPSRAKTPTVHDPNERKVTKISVQSSSEPTSSSVTKSGRIHSSTVAPSMGNEDLSNEISNPEVLMHYRNIGLIVSLLILMSLICYCGIPTICNRSPKPYVRYEPPFYYSGV